jgi:hypothetical protein
MVSPRTALSYRILDAHAHVGVNDPRYPPEKKERKVLPAFSAFAIAILVGGLRTFLPDRYRPSTVSKGAAETCA